MLGHADAIVRQLRDLVPPRLSPVVALRLAEHVRAQPAPQRPMLDHSSTCSDGSNRRYLPSARVDHHAPDPTQVNAYMNIMICRCSCARTPVGAPSAATCGMKLADRSTSLVMLYRGVVYN